MAECIYKNDLAVALWEKGRSKRYKWGETWELNGDELMEVYESLPTVEVMERSKILDFTKAAIRSLPVQVKAKGTPGEVRAAIAGYIAGQKRILELIDELQEYVKEVDHGNGY